LDLFNDKMHSAVLRSLAVVPILCTFATAGHISLGIKRSSGLEKRALSPRDAGSIDVELVESAEKNVTSSIHSDVAIEILINAFSCTQSA